MSDKEGSSCRRGFHPRMAHHVEHTLIALMADAGDDWQREISHVLSQGKGVETGKVAGGTSTADDDHTVEFVK